MSLQSLDTLSSAEFPQLHSWLTTATNGKQLTIGTESNRRYPIGMSLKGEKLLTIRNLPNANLTNYITCG
jgi:hypothetical protein